MLPTRTAARNANKSDAPGLKTDVTTAADAASVRRATATTGQRRIGTVVMRGA